MKVAFGSAMVAVLLVMGFGTSHPLAQDHSHGAPNRTGGTTATHSSRPSVKRPRASRMSRWPRAAGYQLLFGCVSGPDSGAMGLHYVNLPLVLDGVVDPAQPEIILYEPLPNGRLRADRRGLPGVCGRLGHGEPRRRRTAAHGPAVSSVRDAQSFRAPEVLHAARLGVEREPHRHVRELARQRVV